MRRFNRSGVEWSGDAAIGRAAIGRAAARPRRSCGRCGPGR